MLLLVTIDGSIPVHSQSDLEAAVDEILRFNDANDNGLIEYLEFVTAMRKNIQR